MNRYTLVKAGIDVNEGIRRFNNNKEMYERFLMTFLEDTYFEQLEEAVTKNDVKEAFQKAHALKGISGNLSLVRLHADLIPLVEELRADSLERVPELIKPVEKNYQKVIEVLKKQQG